MKRSHFILFLAWLFFISILAVFGVKYLKHTKQMKSMRSKQVTVYPPRTKMTSSVPRQVVQPDTLQVIRPKVERVVIFPNTQSGKRNQTLTFTAGVVFEDYSPEKDIDNYYSQGVNWSISSNEGGTIIDSSGKLTIGRQVITKTLEVIASSKIDPTKSGKANVTVEDYIPITKGPAGGFVFYDKGEYTNGWRYLEAAPRNSDFAAEWGLSRFDFPETSTRLGDGKENTALIIKYLKENDETGKAAQLCAALDINDYTDWFLPSKDELNEMYKVLMLDTNVGGFNGLYYYAYPNWYRSRYWYWSSSAKGYITWSQDFNGGLQTTGYYFKGDVEQGHGRDDMLAVRAVRMY